MKELVKGYIRIIKSVDPLETQRRVYLVDDNGKVICEFKPHEPVVVQIDRKDD